MRGRTSGGAVPGGFRRAWRLLLGRRHVEQAVEEELAYHLERSAEWIAEREGRSLIEARIEARRRFGDHTRYRHECLGVDDRRRRIQARSDWWNDLRQDLRFGWRQIRHTPGVTAAAVICLAVGLSATSTVYEVARYALFSDTAIREPERVLRVYTHLPNRGLDFASYSWPDYRDLRDQVTTLEGLATGTIQPFHLADGDEPVRLWGGTVTGNWFRVHGLTMEAGRDFLPEEDEVPGRHPVLLISYRLWQSRYGRDPGVIGRPVVLNGHPFTIIGVVDRDYKGMMVANRTDLYVPMAMHRVALPADNDALEERDHHFLFYLIGRMRPGVRFEQARSEIVALQARLGELYPETNEDVSARVVTESASRLHPLVRGQFRDLMVLVGVMVGLLLLLTCANVAGLLVARSVVRRREMGIRLSLGAERGRILRQVLTESMLLALLAGAFGLVLTLLTVPLLDGVVPPIDMPIEFGFRVGPGAILIVIVAALSAGGLFGLTPALEASRQDLVVSLTTGRVTPGRRTRLTRRLLVGLQVAITCGLLVASGMVLRSLHNAREIDVGLDAEDVLTAWVFLELQGYDTDAARVYHEQVLERLGTLPGVVSVGTGYNPQLQPTISITTVIPDDWQGSEEDLPGTMYNYIDEGYLPTLGIEVVQGRDFAPTDGLAGDPPVIVNQAFADLYWPGQDPIGRTVRRGTTTFPVVGVVPTGKYFSLGEAPRPYIYFSLRAQMRTAHFYVIRTTGLEPSLVERIRLAFTEVDPALPVAELTPMDTYLATARLGADMMAGLVTVFALIALLLSGIGLYGLIAFSVQQRTQEIGVRTTLGARPEDLVRMLMAGTVRQVSWALALGLVLGALVSFGLANVLYGIAPLDPLSMVGAGAVILVATLLAGWLPARRVVRIDPVRAIKTE